MIRNGRKRSCVRKPPDRLIGGVRDIENALEDAIELITLGEEENDTDIIAEAEASLTEIEATAQQIESLFSGKADGNDRFIGINAGAGGTEAQDWPRCCISMHAWQQRREIDYIEESP